MVISHEHTNPKSEKNLAQKFLPKFPTLTAGEDFAKELILRPGRYKSPYSKSEALELELHLINLQKREAETDTQYLFRNHDYPVPAQWQAILNYLFREKFTTGPHLHFEEHFHDEPKLFSVRLFSQLESEATDGRTSIFAGFARGVDGDFNEAISKVIGELLERYPLLIYQRKQLLRASAAHLSKRRISHLNLNKLAGFNQEQKKKFPRRAFNENSIFFWEKTEELTQKREAYIPAQLIYWNYDALQEPQESYLQQPITNGAAGHFTYEEAVISGIYELIQRDAFLIHWLNSIPPKRVPHDAIQNEATQALLESCRLYQLEVIILETTLDIPVPSFTCVLLDHSGIGPKIIIGGGCDLDREKAIKRSITEAIGIRYWARANLEPSPINPEVYEPFSNHAIGQKERVMIWSSPQMFERFRPFLEGSFTAPKENPVLLPKEPKEILRHLIQIFKALGEGYEIYVHEGKHYVLEKLGYHSVKVTVPALIPLYMRETDAPLGSARLVEVPQKMNLSAGVFPNPLPHPFP